jgi:catechol 2,3-dioxygenase-like lactoylglutathione lyase family enzyme
MSTPIAVNHIAFRCRDFSVQEAFYTRHLGFKRSRTFHRGLPGEFCMLKLGSVRLELFPPQPTTSPDQKGGEQAVGYQHLAFEVPKLESKLESLRAAGVAHDPIIEVTQHDPPFRIVFFRDPEGNVIELMENYRDTE